MRGTGDEPVGPEVADALGKSKQALKHHGSIEVVGSLPRRNRDYSSHTGEYNLRPQPPVEAPVISRGLLELDNAPEGLSDRRGENGYALLVKRGVARVAGESWFIKWGKVTGAGSVEDRWPDDIPDGVDPTYFYLDCLECADAKGRELADVPVRVFTRNQFAAEEGAVIGYIRDQTGIAWMVTDTPGGTGDSLKWWKADGAWQWLPDYEDEIGYAVGRDCASMYGGTQALTTSRVYVVSTKATDPNIQSGDVLGWLPDPDGYKISVHGGRDEKIGSVKIWTAPHEGDDPIETIPGGWAFYGALSGLFPVGAKVDSPDYSPGMTGGLHPIRPHQHESTEPESSTATWKFDQETNKDWYDTGWTLADHPARTCSSSTSHTNAVTGTFTIGPSSTTTSATGTASLSVADLSITGSIGNTSLSASAVVSVAMETAHWHAVASGGGHSHGLSYYAGKVNPDTPGLYSVPCAVSPDNAQHTHHTESTSHTHLATAVVSVDPNPHTHPLTATGGTGTITPNPHVHPIDIEHTHTISSSASHTHIVSAHTHQTQILEHAGALHHREEDFRPPFLASVYIRRIGPEAVE